MALQCNSVTGQKNLKVVVKKPLASDSMQAIAQCFREHHLQSLNLTDFELHMSPLGSGSGSCWGHTIPVLVPLRLEA